MINWNVLSCGRGKKCPEIAKDEEGSVLLKDDFGGSVKIPRENIPALRDWIVNNC